MRLGEKNFPRLQAGVFQRRAHEFEFGPAAHLAHLADGAAESARAVVGDGAVEAEVARLHDEFVEFALGDRVADLYRLRGRLLMQCLGGERRAVNAVLADASAGHDHAVATADGFFLGRLAVERDGQAAERAAKDERLADEPFVESLEATRPRYAALVAAVDHPVMHAIANAARVHEAFGEVAIIERRTEAVAPRVEKQFAAHAGAHRVAVDADDAGDGAAVGVERGRAVVRLYLVYKVITVVEPDHAGVVGEHRNEPVARLGYLGGGGFDEGFVER